MPLSAFLCSITLVSLPPPPPPHEIHRYHHIIIIIIIIVLSMPFKYLVADCSSPKKCSAVQEHVNEGEEEEPAQLSSFIVKQFVSAPPSYALHLVYHIRLLV